MGRICLEREGKSFTRMRNDMKIRLKMASVRSGKITRALTNNGVHSTVVGANTPDQGELGNMGRGAHILSWVLVICLYNLKGEV